MTPALSKPLRLESKREDDLRLVEDREWTEAFLAGERRILEMIAKGESLVPILDAMCRLVEEMSSGSLATILLLDAEGKRLRHAAAPSLPASYTEGMGAIAVGPSVGSCGTAVYRREPVIVTDIATDPLWTDYRDLPLAHGSAGELVNPHILLGGLRVGNICHPLPRTAQSGSSCTTTSSNRSPIWRRSQLNASVPNRRCARARNASVGWQTPFLK